MIDVTLQNFETEVMETSKSTPVLVDFWADWCGPCKSLGPVLEKLETAYEGCFKLVKVNADEEQQLSSAFGVRSLPTCILLIDGKPVDGFMGALPEGKVREFLDKHLPTPEEVAAEEEEEEALDLLAEGNADAALEKLQHAVATDPANEAARFDYVKLLLQMGRDDDAKVAFAPVIATTAQNRRFDALQRWMNAIDSVAETPDFSKAEAGFDAKIAANRRDFDARFAKAQLLMATQRWTEAMDELLDILMRDKAWHDDLARKTCIAILELIEPPRAKVADGQIPPQDPTVASYRRRLSSVVLS
ncbi:MAG: thioredoxin [Pseudomonadota bacterium]